MLQFALLFFVVGAGAGSAPSNQSRWRYEPGTDLSAALRAGNEAAVFRSNEGWCIDQGRWTGSADQPPKWVWASCPTEPAGSIQAQGCHLLETAEPPRPSILAEHCPQAALEFAELEGATCGERSLETLLQRASTLTLHRPKVDPSLSALQHRVGCQFFGEQIGCALTQTSTDGRMRTWTLQTAERGDSSPNGDEVHRGRAYIQWLDGEGQSRFALDQAETDLSLDAYIRGIFPLPGHRGSYLVTGYSYRGFDLVLFAEVVQLSGAHPQLTRSFLIGGKREAVLVVSAGYPETGKARHSPVYNHRLRLDGRRLWVEAYSDPDCDDGGLAKAGAPFVLAEWTGDAFRVSAKRWARVKTVRELGRNK